MDALVEILRNKTANKKKIFYKYMLFCHALMSCHNSTNQARTFLISPFFLPEFTFRDIKGVVSNT